MEAPIIAVSDKPQFQRVIRLEVPALVDTSGRMVKAAERKIVAQFVRGAAPDWIVEQARSRFDFRGRGDGEPIQMLIGVFDSKIAAAVHKWSEEEHDAVVRDLRDTANPYWFIAEQPKVEAPWPTYDALVVQGQRTAEKVAEKNLELAASTGIGVDVLVAYEEQNRADERIIAAYRAALEAVAAAEPAEELIEA